EGHLTAQDIGDFVAIVVEMVWRHGARWRGFLEHHHVLTGLAALHLECSRSAGCHVPYRSLTGQHDEALRIHGHVLRAFPDSKWTGKRGSRLGMGARLTSEFARAEQPNGLLNSAVSRVDLRPSARVTALLVSGR